jgi:hypothetical protein
MKYLLFLSLLLFCGTLLAQNHGGEKINNHRIFAVNNSYIYRKIVLE